MTVFTESNLLFGTPVGGYFLERVVQVTSKREGTTLFNDEETN